MNDLNIFLAVSNVIIPVLAFILTLLALKHLYDYVGEVPVMWKNICFGLFFFAFSEIFGMYRIIFQQATHHFNFFTNVLKIVGLTFFFTGIVPYIKEITGV